MVRTHRAIQTKPELARAQKVLQLQCAFPRSGPITGKEETAQPKLPESDNGDSSEVLLRCGARLIPCLLGQYSQAIGTVCM
jgi:hypothetical protein